MRKWIYGLVSVSLFIRVLPAAPDVRHEVISSIEQVKEVFGATAGTHEGKLEFTLRPSPEWLRFGKFVFYTLRLSPTPIRDLKRADTTLKSRTIVETNESRIAKFEVAEKHIQKSYVVAHFQFGRLQDEGPAAVLIPLSLLRDLAEKRSNPNHDGSEPSTASGVGGNTKR